MELVEVGYVARAHGIRGEVRVVCHNPDSTLLLDVPRITIAGAVYEVARARAARGACLLALVGVDDRTRAEALRGRAVEVERELLPLDDDDVLLAELVGLATRLPDGTPWGEVVAVELGPQDRLVIHHGDVERLLPVVDAYILDIDLEGGHMVVDPPDGWPEASLGRRR